MHYSYDFFPHRASTALSLQGLLGAVLLWRMRHDGGRLLWLVCLFGVIEGAQVFVCQMASNWIPADAPRFSGICDAYSGLPLYAWGVVALAMLAAHLHDNKEEGNHRGH